MRNAALLAASLLVALGLAEGAVRVLGRLHVPDAGSRFYAEVVAEPLAPRRAALAARRVAAQ